VKPAASLVLLALACLVALDAHARPGGGQGYSGGGGGSSGGSSSGDGLIFELLIRLIIYYPQVGIPLAIAVLVIFWLRARHGATVRSEQFSSSGSLEFTDLTPRPTADLASLRRATPSSRSCSSRTSSTPSTPASTPPAATRRDGRCSPPTSPRARATPSSSASPRRPGRSTASSSARCASPRAGPRRARRSSRIELEFEANYTAHGSPRPPGLLRARALDRRARREIVTRASEPGDAWEFRCPNCGAAFTSPPADERCRFCKQEVGERPLRLDRQPRPHAASRRPAPRRSPPTSPSRAPTRRTALRPRASRPSTPPSSPRIPAPAPERIEQRLRDDLQRAQRRLDRPRPHGPIRPLVSDALYNYLVYWISAYRSRACATCSRTWRSQRMHHRQAGPRPPLRRHHDPLLGRGPRLHRQRRTTTSACPASKLQEAQAYSEYWTLIRGAKVRGAPRDADAPAPAAAPPLDRVSMAGTCEYCGAHLTRGEFDWVLSKIEQDESYAADTADTIPR
jgi:hypothetical protein